MAERFFDDDAGPCGAARFDQLFHDRSEQMRRDRQIVRRSLGAFQFFAERLERRLVFVVTVHVAQQST